MYRQYQLPDSMHSQIQKIFADLRWDWSPRRLAEDVLRLSDYYIQNPKGVTPWDQSWAQRALLVYYWPLNTLRFQSVYQELDEQHFFDGIKQFYDFGAGPGTASAVLQRNQKKVTAIESSPIPQRWFPEIQWSDKFLPESDSCTVLSYSLTELNQLPQAAFSSEALIIIEPATQTDGRNLLRLRELLLGQNYFAWAPCSHQEACPLLTQSKNDWCHDRIHFESPKWFSEIEQHLPIKNKTLTMSYLAVKKVAPPARSWARLTSDRLTEKGKTRQLVCRGPAREFLSWMHRDGEPPEYFLGEKVVLENFEIKSNELRVKSMKRHSTSDDLD